MARLKRWFFRKNKNKRVPLPGDRPEHEIRKEVERDLRKWQMKALLYGDF